MEESPFVLVGSLESRKGKIEEATLAGGTKQQRNGKGDIALEIRSVVSVAPQGVRLDQTVGITCTHNGNLAVNPVNGNIAYPTGQIVVLANAKLDHELFHFFCRKAI